MVSKKLLMLGGLFAALSASPALAQENNTGGTGTKTGSSYAGRDMTYRGESYDVLDSTYVPGSRRDQHRKFLNNQYNFPAKPRSMWEVGVGVGQYSVSGDVPSLMAWQHGGYGFDVHVRKALGYIVSMRLDYTYGVAKGLQWQPSGNYRYNSAWYDNSGAGGASSKGYVPEGLGTAVKPTNSIFYNYRMESHQATLDFIASTNNIRFHKAHTGVGFYGFMGIGANAYQTWINTMGANGQDYTQLFAAVLAKYAPLGTQIDYSQRGDVRSALRNGLNGIAGMDNTYETGAESASHVRRPGIFGNHTLNPVFSYGAGAQFRVSRRMNISIEDRVTSVIGTDEDLMDGQRWAEQVPGSPVMTQNRDNINYASVGFNFNIGGGNKNVEPLYWLNPLDYSYGELSSPRHMVLPEPILSDADGDGIADQFDKCPGTPAGVAVDSHGCPMDTDGDGVPDDRDKQLITPTECQPVDADGVGKCPCNCPMVPGGGAVGCSNTITPGSIMFSGAAARITPAMQAQLAQLAAQMQAHPDCNVVVLGNGGGSKIAQQRSWERVNAVIEYMTEKHNITRNRFFFHYQDAGAPDNGVMYRGAQEGETGENNVVPPHPELHGR